jgi:hypothetical protein
MVRDFVSGAAFIPGSRGRGAYGCVLFIAASFGIPFLARLMKGTAEGDSDAGCILVASLGIGLCILAFRWMHNSPAMDAGDRSRYEGPSGPLDSAMRECEQPVELESDEGKPDDLPRGASE